MSSNALAIKAHVYELIRSLPELEGVQVTYGVPKSFDKRWVALGRVRWDSSEWATNRAREEVFSIEGLCSVVSTAGDASSVESAALAMGAAIEDAVKASPGFGNTHVVTSGFKPTNITSFPNDTEGYEAQYEWIISVTARL